VVWGEGVEFISFCITEYLYPSTFSMPYSIRKTANKYLREEGFSTATPHYVGTIVRAYRFEGV
jgi:hypothetical protein